MVYYEEGHPDYEQTTGRRLVRVGGPCRGRRVPGSPADRAARRHRLSSGRPPAAAAESPVPAPWLCCLALVSVRLHGAATRQPAADGYRPGTGSHAPGTPETDTGSGPDRRRSGVQDRLDLQLEIPWAAVFLPDGTAIISERDSALLKAVRDGRAATDRQGPRRGPGGEGGLLGLALSPDFAADRYLYLYFTAGRGQPDCPRHG